MADSLNPSDSFEGAIFARGLDIEESVLASPPDADRIRWIEASTGLSREEIIGKFFAGVSSLLLSAGGTSGHPRTIGDVALLAYSDNANNAGLTVHADSGGLNLTLARVDVNSLSRLLLNGNGKSDFVQGLAEQGLKVIRGTISTTLPTILSGSGFSVVRNGVGNITVTFTTPFSGAASVMATVADGIVDHGSIVTTANSTRLRVYNDAATLQESTVEFMAIGPI